jgi:hypothetical protein
MPNKMEKRRLFYLHAVMAKFEGMPEETAASI